MLSMDVLVHLHRARRLGLMQAVQYFQEDEEA